ncbi:MAG: cysteine desulfurase [Clostridia bacterium]|nr:cysteine desulfurase [Clostridia bacterium]
MIYMDNAATTRVFDEAAKQALYSMTDAYGNPESRHGFGFSAERTVSRARKALAHAAGVSEEEIYFTSSATVASNTAIRGAVASKRGGRIISTAFEHPAVEEVLQDLEKTFEVVRLKPVQGNITVDAFREALSRDTVLVTCMQVNNETGAITPLREMAALLKRSGIEAPFHSDAVQGFLKEDFRYSLIDMASFAGHKVHGPKGVGALYLRKGLRIKPVILGGGQEKNLFSGTHNVPAVAGWGVACRIMEEQKNQAREKIQRINTKMRKGILDLGGEINSPSDASPYVINAAFRGYLGENILNYLSEREIYISTGSACSSKKPSRVMAAIGKEDLSRFALRFSFSSDNTEQEAGAVLQALSDALREISPIR